MNQIETQLKREVMQRAHAVHFMQTAVRLVTNREFLKGAVLGACSVAAIFLVSIPNVMANVSHMPGIVQGIAYLYSAFMHTSIIVEAVIVLALLAGGWLAFDAVRNFKQVYSLPIRVTFGLIQRFRSA